MRRRTNGGVLNTRQRRERKIASSEMNRRQRERRKTKRGSRRAGQPQIHGFRTPYRRQEQPGEIQPPEAKAKKPPAQATWRGPARSPPSSFRSRRRRESREHSVAQESESLESPGTPPPPPHRVYVGAYSGGKNPGIRSPLSPATCRPIKRDHRAGSSLVLSRPSTGEAAATVD